MRSIRISALFILLFAHAVLAQSPAPAARGAATITAADLQAHVEFLASDELRGRDTPSPGLEMAARYIADHFAKLGLKPAGDSGTFIQRWPYTTRKIDTSRLSAELAGKTRHALKLGEEFFVLPAPSVDSLAGEVVYLGVAAPQLDANPANEGKIVAFYAPGGDMGRAWQQTLQGAVLAAYTSRVRGVVFLLDPEFGADDIAAFTNATAGAAAPMPVLGVRNDVARKWLDGTGVSLDPVPAESKVLKGATLRLRSAMAGSESRPPNVVAILEGSDPVLKDTYVVYSAHMDHVGVQRPNEKGDSIYNGADDDASGTSAILELAEAFTALAERPKRSIIFLTVSGEEKGLFGSKYFVENPPVPTDKMVANINLDMIGRNAPDTTVAIGQEYSSLGETVQAVVKANPQLGLVVAPDLWPEERLFFRSDHYNFAVKKVPAIFFTSGLHADYHKPSDEAHTLDNDKLARTTQLVFWLGHDIATNPTAPAWTEAGLRAVGAIGQ